MGEGGSAGVRASGRKTVLTAYLDGSLELEQDGLVDKNFAGFRAEILDLVLLQLYGLPWTVSSHWTDEGGGQETRGRLPRLQTQATAHLPTIGR